MPVLSHGTGLKVYELGNGVEQIFPQSLFTKQGFKVCELDRLMETGNIGKNGCFPENFGNVMREGEVR
jgi:hypothetical protein